jgi:uncharacterized protein (UPF0128 family)
MYHYDSPENTIHEHVVDPTRIYAWLHDHRITNYTVDNCGTVNIMGDLTMTDLRCWNLFVRFGQVSGNVLFSHGSSVVTFEGFPKVVCGNLNVASSRITSMTGLDKVVKYVGGNIVGRKGMTHLLGTLLIPGVKNICIDQGEAVDRILNRYLGTGDIISAQDELIDAGYVEQARL